MRHAVVIRLKYRDGEEFEWRLAFFRAVCLRSLLNQRDQSFDIVVLCNPEHEERLRSLSEKIVTINMDVPISGDADYRRKGERNSVMPFHYDLNYDIQTRLDSDDIVMDGFTEKVLKVMDAARGPRLACFKARRLHLDTLHIYRVHMDHRRSPFLSVYNPRRDTFIYEVGHGGWKDRILEIGGDIEVVNAGHCYQVAHGRNASTHIKRRDKLLR